MDSSIRVWESPSERILLTILRDCVDLFDAPKIANAKAKPVLLNRSSIIRYLSSIDAHSQALCVRNILLNYLVNANKECKGSEIWLPTFIMKKTKLLENMRISSQTAITETLKIVSNPRVRSILKLVPKLMGSSGRIISEISKQSQDILEITNGYNIKLTVDSRFINQIGTTRISLDHAKILIIEGAPKSVAELNKFLEQAHEESTPIILVARSFPEEVIATLAINWLKKTLYVVPMIYGNLLENINAHADLSAVSGAVPITPMKGDTLSVDFEERFGYINNVNISNSSIVFSGTTSPDRILSSLFEKLKNLDMSNPDKIQVYTDRISGLSDDLLTIKIMETPDAFLVKDELDVAISYYNHLCYLASRVEIDSKEYIIPSMVYNTSNEYAKSFITHAKSIGGYLVLPAGKN